ncbi:MAG: RsmB/NOP family class I SAM-dependent RNA methyltransferase [Verrucomicrobia bacterium]|nr:RsmB/NOP family class I SAM-dependent RNA methyltransferase [Verrucomicrobiota bacterium]
MSVVGSQRQVFLGLLRQLQPHWRRDPALPARLQRLLAGERRFGGRDRRLYRELVYTTLRYLPWIEPELDHDAGRAAVITAWLAADTRDTHAYRAGLCGDWPEIASLAGRAANLAKDPAVLLPAWFREHAPAVFEPVELEVQLARAPLWLRLQTDNPDEVAAELSSLGWTWTSSDVCPAAWRLEGEVDVTKTRSFQAGQVEVQDLGSQMVLLSAGVVPGERWLDACAGAGGKAVQLARLVGAGGRVDAHDIRPAALAELKHRADRAGLGNIAVVARTPSGTFDGVLLDAPCSGTGTWRRAPHLKWVTTPAFVAERARLQGRLLDQFAGAVKPGGRLVYATCSLSREENEAVVEAFLSRNMSFVLEPPAATFGFATTGAGLTILPSRHNTDGFYAAHLRRR